MLRLGKRQKSGSKGQDLYNRCLWNMGAEGIAIVGLYRTSPSGSPDFNLLDNKTLDDMLMDIIYMIVGGNSEIQIAVKDKRRSLKITSKIPT
ncbi:Uncharacterised protein [Allocoprococcus comes]|uniref:Uncharacterized protein n=2 Tax=Coprococcus comes TaxID=410072 RepID=A0A173TEF7_9FIRM|nr:Uncharacterised protein [Coprococcus comes]